MSGAFTTPRNGERSGSPSPRGKRGSVPGPRNSENRSAARSTRSSSATDSTASGRTPRKVVGSTSAQSRTVARAAGSKDGDVFVSPGSKKASAPPPTTDRRNLKNAWYGKEERQSPRTKRASMPPGMDNSAATDSGSNKQIEIRQSPRGSAMTASMPPNVERLLSAAKALESTDSDDSFNPGSKRGSDPSVWAMSSAASTRPSLRPKDDGRIQVCIRCRPLNVKEDQEGSKFIWSLRPQHTVELDDDERTPTGKTWAFDNVFGPDIATKTLFDLQCRPIIQSALDGYNGTIFAYGQTSSGKTYTLMGNPEVSPGVSILAVDEIFSWISANSHVEWDTYASYIEIYNESLTDLLQKDTRKSKNMKIIEDKVLGPTVKDLKELPVLNRQHCLDLILDGEKRRTYATTMMNESSSRSHTLFRLRIEARSGGAKQKERCTESMSRVASEFLSMQNELTADHASLYLVDQTTNELFIQAGEITLRLPMSQGIAGAVATTGETINIADAYKDDRFDSSIDKKTGYRTKSILCMPIYGTDEQAAGVVQFINKMKGGDEGFDRNDELLVAGLTQRLGPLISAAQGNATMSLRSQLNLVDLAGSERVAKTGARGDVLKQAGYINQSLHALGACIAILAEGKKQHVPFRDSKLTQMLSSALGGNAKTVLICAISPASSNRSETVSTLQFASRAKKIVNHLHRNCQRDQSELVEAYESEIAKLKAQIQQGNRRSSFLSPDQEASYALQSNKLQSDASSAYSEEFGERLNQFEVNVAEAQGLANKPVAGRGFPIILRAMIATEKGKKDEPELVVRASIDMEAGQEVQSENVGSWAQWISEEEFDSRLDWLRKQDQADMLTSLTTNGNHAWDYAGAAIGLGVLLPGQSSPRAAVPQVKLDGLRMGGVPGGLAGSFTARSGNSWDSNGAGRIRMRDDGELPFSSDVVLRDTSETVYSMPGETPATLGSVPIVPPVVTASPGQVARTSLSARAVSPFGQVVQSSSAQPSRLSSPARLSSPQRLSSAPASHLATHNTRASSPARMISPIGSPRGAGSRAGSPGAAARLPPAIVSPRPPGSPRGTINGPPPVVMSPPPAGTPALGSPPASPLITGAPNASYYVAYQDNQLQGIFRNLQENNRSLQRKLYYRMPVGQRVVSMRATL